MSKLTDFYGALDRVAPGWAKDRYTAALADTASCAQSARSVAGGVNRMIAFIECRRGKKLPIG